MTCRWHSDWEKEHKPIKIVCISIHKTLFTPSTCVKTVCNIQKEQLPSLVSVKVFSSFSVLSFSLFPLFSLLLLLLLFLMALLLLLLSLFFHCFKAVFFLKIGKIFYPTFYFTSSGKFCIEHRYCLTIKFVNHAED